MGLRGTGQGAAGARHLGIPRVKGELGKSVGVPCLGPKSCQAQGPSEGLVKGPDSGLGLGFPPLTTENRFLVMR